MTYFRSIELMTPSVSLSSFTRQTRKIHSARDESAKGNDSNLKRHECSNSCSIHGQLSETYGGVHNSKEAREKERERERERLQGEQQRVQHRVKL